MYLSIADFTNLYIEYVRKEHQMSKKDGTRSIVRYTFVENIAVICTYIFRKLKK